MSLITLLELRGTLNTHMFLLSETFNKKNVIIIIIIFIIIIIIVIIIITIIIIIEWVGIRRQ